MKISTSLALITGAIHFFVITSSWAYIVDSSVDRGSYIETFGKKRLTPQWSQEYVGNDLIRDELEYLNRPKIELAIFDLGFEQEFVTLNRPISVPPEINSRRQMTANHGTSVASIINGPSPYGHSSQVDLVNLSAIKFPGYYTYIFRQFEQEKLYPKIISNSLGWSTDSVLKAVDQAYKRNILWFLASGNDWPKEVRKREIESKALLVGSFAPNGLTTFGTQLHADMLILAPSNSEILAIDGKGRRTLFGGTSGATPVVAATMANIASLWKGITREITKKLLLNTSYASAENKLGDKDSPRLLNAYKAFKVSQRILSYCSESENLEICFKEALDIPGFYYFDLNLITCDSFKDTHRDFQMSILKKMRRRALLGVVDQDEQLACAYDEIGFSANAEFYRFRSQNKIEMNEYLVQVKNALNQGIIEIEFYKYLKFMDRSEVESAINASDEITDYHKKELLELIHQ